MSLTKSSTISVPSNSPVSVQISTNADALIQSNGAAGEQSLIDVVTDKLEQLAYTNNTGDNALMQAVRLHQYEYVQQLLDFKMSPDLTNIKNNMNCLELAASLGDQQMVNLIQTFQASFQEQTDLTKLKNKMVELSVVNKTAHNGDDLLLQAIRLNKVELVRQVLEQKIQHVNLSYNFKLRQYALDAAYAVRSPEIMRLLFEHGATKISNFFFSTLFVSPLLHPFLEECLVGLKGDCTNHTSNDMFSKMQWETYADWCIFCVDVCRKRNLPDVIWTDCLENIFLDKTNIHLVRTQEIRKIWKAFPDLTVKDSWIINTSSGNLSCLNFQKCLKHLSNDVLKRLINFPDQLFVLLNTNGVTHDPITVDHLGSAEDYHLFMLLLSRFEGDLNQRMSTGARLMDKFTSPTRQLRVDALLEKKAEVTLHQLNGTDAHYFPILSSHFNGDINGHMENGNTLLDEAVRYHNLQKISQLLDHKATVNVNHLVNASVETLPFLLNHFHGNINDPLLEGNSDFNNTLLGHALNTGETSRVEWLLKKNASVDLLFWSDKVLYTPLSFALRRFEYKEHPIIDLLIKHGALMPYKTKDPINLELISLHPLCGVRPSSCPSPFLQKLIKQCPQMLKTTIDGIPFDQLVDPNIFQNKQPLGLTAQKDNIICVLLGTTSLIAALKIMKVI